MSVVGGKQEVQEVGIKAQRMGGKEDQEIDHISSLDENINEDLKSRLEQQITIGVGVCKSKFN